MSTASNLVCPQGHGPQPQIGNFCYFCGARMVLKGVVLGPPGSAAHSPGSAAAHPAVLPGPAGNAVQLPAQPQPQTHWPPPVTSPMPKSDLCQTCGGEGAALDPLINVCPQCSWIRPLTPGYKLDCSMFQWAQDGTAMQKLRSIGPLNSAARAVSDKVGRPWIEGLFNAVLVSERQLPYVYQQAVLAARVLNVPRMPDVYVSGERMWEAATYGSDQSAFIVLGTALVTSFQGDDLLFLLAREMGHCRAHHALWKTVSRFLAGEQRPGGGLMGGGLLSMLDITKLVEGAVELPLLAWARQSEITADRAGLLAVRDESVARRVLLTSCLRSLMVFKQVNIAEWMKQQEDVEDHMSRLSELAMSPTPYITRRLRLLSQFAKSPELEAWRTHVGPLIDAVRTATQAAPPPVPQPATPPGISRPPQTQPAAKELPKDDVLRLKCASCGTELRVPRSVLQGKDVLNVRCANPRCKNVTTLKRGAAAARPKPPAPPDDDLRLKCAGCGTRLRVPSNAMAGKDLLKVRCPNAQCGRTMTLKKKSAAAPALADPKPAKTTRKAKRARSGTGNKNQKK